MPSRIRRKKKYKFSVCIFYLVDMLYPVCSLHFVSTGLILLFLFERASSPDRNIGARKNNIVRLSWPLWLMCRLYVEELPRTSTMIEQRLLSTNWRRTQMRGLTIWLTLVPLLRGHNVCWNEHFGFSTQLAFLEVREGIWGYYFY